ncbi:MAG: lysylphosphatidylglycerol synthase transmembrane domain-containing protein [Bacteroidota bacterium]
MTSDKKKKSVVRKIFGYLLPILLTLIFLYITFKDVNLAQTFDLIIDSSFTWFIIFTISFFISHVIRAIRWKVMLKSVKPNTSLLYLLGATMIGYGVNSLVPRLGELYRGMFAGRWEGISRSSVIGSVVVERVVDILILGLSVLISVIIYPGDLYSDITWLKPALYLGFFGIFSIIATLILLVKMKHKFYDWIVKFIGRFSVKWAEKLSYIFEMLIDGFSTIKGVINYFWVIVLSALIMLSYGLTSYFAFFVLNFDGFYEVSFAMAWIVMTISAFGVIIPTPGGTGTYHFIAKSVLVGLFAFSQEAGSAFALLTHTVSMVIFISSMFFFIVFINRYRAKLGFPKETFFSVIKGEST